MKLTFDRRYDKMQQHKADRERCDKCMEDAPHEYCCKNQCGKFTYCNNCTANCRTTNKLCDNQ